MRFAFGYRCGEVCPRECPKRAPGCHNAETCERWAAYEAKKRERYAAAAQRSRGKRMCWEERKTALNK